MKYLIGFILYLNISMLAGAAMFTQVEESEVAWDKLNYYHHFTMWWDDDNDPSPNPCYGLKACTLMFGPMDKSGIVFASTTDGNSRIFSTYTPEILRARTMGELRAIYASLMPIPIKGKVMQSIRYTPPNICISMVYKPTIDSIVSGASPIPSVRCGIAPPPVGSCEVKNSVINLDYGELSPDEVNGRRKSSVINIQCSKPTQVKLYTMAIGGGNNNTGEVYLRNDGSLSAFLALDGVVGHLGKEFAIGSNGVDVKIESILNSRGNISEGAFFGQAIVLMTVY